jgi:hypothetical protein
MNDVTFKMRLGLRVGKSFSAFLMSKSVDSLADNGTVLVSSKLSTNKSEPDK